MIEIRESRIDVDSLFNAALSRVEETVNAIPCKAVEKVKNGEWLDEGIDIESKVNMAINAIDALKSALKTFPYR